LASPDTYFPLENNGSLTWLHSKNHHAHRNILPGNLAAAAKLKK